MLAGKEQRAQDERGAREGAHGHPLPLPLHQPTGEPAAPVHDEYSHGADAFRGLGLIVDKIRNAGDRPPPQRLPTFSTFDASMGALG